MLRSTGCRRLEGGLKLPAFTSQTRRLPSPGRTGQPLGVRTPEQGVCCQADFTGPFTMGWMSGRRWAICAEATSQIAASRRDRPAGTLAQTHDRRQQERGAQANGRFNHKLLTRTALRGEGTAVRRAPSKNGLVPLKMRPSARSLGTL